jgi:hypothetical protein
MRKGQEKKNIYGTTDKSGRPHPPHPEGRPPLPTTLPALFAGAPQTPARREQNALRAGIRRTPIGRF